MDCEKPNDYNRLINPSFSQQRQAHRDIWVKFVRRSVHEARQRHSGSTVFHITALFNPKDSRFHGLSTLTGYERRQRIARLSKELFSQFMDFYKRLLRKMINNFRRKSKHPLHPEVMAFIDDKKGGRYAYPHIHAIIVIPNEYIDRFKQWVQEGRHKKAWKAIERWDDIEIVECRTDRHVRKVCYYVTKYIQWHHDTGTEDVLFDRYPKEELSRKPKSVPVARTTSNQKAESGTSARKRHVERSIPANHHQRAISRDREARGEGFGSPGWISCPSIGIAVYEAPSGSFSMKPANQNFQVARRRSRRTSKGLKAPS